MRGPLCHILPLLTVVVEVWIEHGFDEPVEHVLHVIVAKVTCLSYVHDRLNMRVSHDEVHKFSYFKQARGGGGHGAVSWEVEEVLIISAL